MKRVGNLFSKMISDANIRNAIDEVNRGHRWRANHQPNKTVMWVELTIDDRVKELRKIITDGFIPTKPTVKRRYDSNARKWRDISEPRLYPDQYVHHILIGVLKPVFMKCMDRYCCGSIEGKGTIYGVNAIKKWMKDDVKGTKYCAELDIYHFYEQLNPEIVMSRLKCLIKDFRVLDLCERSMKHGVTIGAFFSQWFANTMLQPLDQKIHECGVDHYLRYMDNFTIFASSKKTLKKTIRCINNWLKEHGMRLKDNWQYFPTRKRSVDALGYRFSRSCTLIRKRRLLNIKRQVRSYFRQKSVSFRFACSLLSRIGGLRHCNSQNIYRMYIPKGLQRRLKNVIRKYQREEMLKWNTCLAQYAMMA